MSRDIVIRAEGLGKKYIIGHAAERERYTALRDVLSRNVQNVWRRTLEMAKGRPVVAGDTVEEFWALKHLDFEVGRGDVVGIIGRNGAGKTTLLKILSRITEPTQGRVTIKGRVASLLEVGTGFHPELTGSENVYLNGAILGMSRSEIRRKFDEIVAFAEVERFLDTPVKRYSSGMYVRLAFAVAAHLDPEILVVDEVLAVGDQEFQKKCLGKMSQVAGGGRTVLFVSHNMSAIETLCPRSIYLACGSLMAAGDTPAVISKYLDHRPSSVERTKGVRLNDLEIESVECSPKTIIAGDPFEIEMVVRAERSGSIRECAVLIYSIKGIRVAVLDMRDLANLPIRYTSVERIYLKLRVEAAHFVEGTYLLGMYIVTDHFARDVLDLSEFVIVERRIRNHVPYSSSDRGFVDLKASGSISSKTVYQTVDEYR
jgi:lipopolysaccharide transport system ATP-binding protein